MIHNPDTVEVKDEGTTQGRARVFDFVGGGVTASVSGQTATISVSGGGGGSLSEASIAFTDGDTCRRVTITDAGVSASSKINGTVRRPDTADDSADPGYIYLANIVRIGSGAFDVLIACLGWGFDDPTGIPPNETVKFYYSVA